MVVARSEREAGLRLSRTGGSIRSETSEERPQIGEDPRTDEMHDGVEGRPVGRVSPDGPSIVRRISERFDNLASLVEELASPEVSDELLFARTLAFSADRAKALVKRFRPPCRRQSVVLPHGRQG